MVLDAAAAVCAVNLPWARRFTYVAWTGFPLMFGCLGAAWACGALPASLDAWGAFEPAAFVALLVGVDLAQTALHRLAHTRWRHTPLGRAHAVHHRHRRPAPEDAFDTGAADALVQLVAPVLAALRAVAPSRATAVAYGAAYSWWLLFLHSSPDVHYPRLAALGLVTPAHHHAHHAHPASRFSTLFRAL